MSVRPLFVSRSEHPALSAVGTGPGLGNLCFRRAGSGAGFLYVSNLDDGMIYRVDSTTLFPVGAPFDHGVQGRGAASLLPLIPDTGAPGLSPVGRRVWGVKTYQNRLCYAVWWENSRSIHATEWNEIWSVDLDNNGNFIPATATLRATVPDSPQPGTTLPVTHGQSREFFKVRSVDPVFGKP